MPACGMLGKSRMEGEAACPTKPWRSRVPIRRASSAQSPDHPGRNATFKARPSAARLTPSANRASGRRWVTRSSPRIAPVASSRSASCWCRGAKAEVPNSGFGVRYSALRSGHAQTGGIRSFHAGGDTCRRRLGVRRFPRAFGAMHFVLFFLLRFPGQRHTVTGIERRTTLRGGAAR